MSGDLTVKLSHTVPENKQLNTFLRAQKEGDAPMQPPRKVVLDVTVRDGRGQGLKLDEASFELVNHPTALNTQHFYENSQKVTADYYDEMKALFTKVTGSPHVTIFHHQVRNQEKVQGMVQADGSLSTSTPVQPYATDSIHTDSTCFHAEGFFQQMVGSQPEECRRGRFLYINAWRNIAQEPILDNHLAVLDERSLVKPDDYVQGMLHGVGYEVLQYSLSSRNAHNHRWYYFPKMTMDEVLLFKQWDSDPQLSGRVCFHTAISDPSAPDGASARQSIEIRAMVFFPEHEPNTCPLMPVLKNVGDCDEDVAQGGAKKINGALDYIQANESMRAMIVGFMKGIYTTGGAEAVLREFAEDKQGHMGLSESSAATKARAVELCLQQGLETKVTRIFNGPSTGRLSLRMILKSHLTSALFGAIAALALRGLLRRQGK